MHWAMLGVCDDEGCVIKPAWLPGTVGGAGLRLGNKATWLRRIRLPGVIRVPGAVDGAEGAKRADHAQDPRQPPEVLCGAKGVRPRLCVVRRCEIRSSRPRTTRRIRASRPRSCTPQDKSSADRITDRISQQPTG